jgi:hypothetical protein
MGNGSRGTLLRRPRPNKPALKPPGPTSTRPRQRSVGRCRASHVESYLRRGTEVPGTLTASQVDLADFWPEAIHPPDFPRRQTPRRPSVPIGWDDPPWIKNGSPDAMNGVGPDMNTTDGLTELRGRLQAEKSTIRGAPPRPASMEQLQARAVNQRPP